MKRLAFLLALLPLAAQGATLVANGRVIWQEDEERFGGLSGIEVADDGRFLAISDRGMYFGGRLIHAGGELVGVDLLAQGAIPDSKGNPVTGHNADAEGLAVDPAGRIFMSFEANHRVMVQDDPAQASTFLPKHPDFRTLQNNSGLEALAADAQGFLYAVPERSGQPERPFPVYVFDGETWRIPYHIPRRGTFLVTGADFGPDGRLYVLERGFSWLGGFKTRVRRFSLPDMTEETLLETPAGTLDNMEGISLWGRDGQTYVTLVSDDNFNPLQKTMLVEYRLVE